MEENVKCPNINCGQLMVRVKDGKKKMGYL